MKGKAYSWWKDLNKKERELLIEVLYDLDFVDMGIVVNKKTHRYERRSK